MSTLFIPNLCLSGSLTSCILVRKRSFKMWSGGDQRLRVWTEASVLVERILLTSLVSRSLSKAQQPPPIYLLQSVVRLTSRHLHNTNSAPLPPFTLSHHSLEEERGVAAKCCLWSGALEPERRFHGCLFLCRTKFFFSLSLGSQICQWDD